MLVHTGVLRRSASMATLVDGRRSWHLVRLLPATHQPNREVSLLASSFEDGVTVLGVAVVGSNETSIKVKELR